MHKFLKDTTMLIKFAVTNYRGFADRIELDLSHPNNYTFNTFAIKGGIVKNGIIYGPNGCGKTNFSLAIFDIVNHLSQKWKKLNYYTNFKNAGSKDDAVSFEYTFNLGGTTLHYDYTKDPNGGLLTEKLSVGKDVIFDKTRNNLEIDGNLFPIDAKVKDSLAANGILFADAWSNAPQSSPAGYRRTLPASPAPRPSGTGEECSERHSG